MIPAWARRAEEAGFATLGTADRFAYPSLREAVKRFEALGTDELILSPGTDDLDEVTRLADIVL